MNKNKIELMKAIEELGINIMLVNKYVNGNIDEAIKVVNKRKNEKPDFISIKDTGYVTFLNRITVPMKTYTELISFKKIQDNKKDFIKLGEEIKKVGDEMISYGLLHKDDKTEDKKEDKKEKKNSKQLFEEFIDSIFEDLD